MPTMFALGDKVIGDPALATFAAFGSFAMLLLVDFGGSMRDRLQAQAALALVGGMFVCAGTLASRSIWLAAVAMAVVGFAVLFAGVASSVLAGATTSLLLAFILSVSLAGPISPIPAPVAGAVVGFAVLFAGVASSVLAGATTSLLLAFILSVSLAGPISSIPARVEGWGMAAGAALLAVALLWPAPAHDLLRSPASTACRALAARLRADVAYVVDGEGGASPAD